MAVSVFDLFTIGIGPSSSHTVGPMRAARRFVSRLDEKLHPDESSRLDDTARVQAELFGSLALTGKGHGTDRAVLMGLEGEEPETIDPTSIDDRVAAIETDREISLFGRRPLAFDVKKDLLFRRREKLPYHTNGMRFTAWNGAEEKISERVFYSVGGGFVVNEDTASEDRIVADRTPVPYPFKTGKDLLEICEKNDLEIWQVMLANETSWRDEAGIRSKLLEIAAAMQRTIEAGCRNEGQLPGGLEVSRRAPKLARDLRSRPEDALKDPLMVLDWVAVFAMAVNEENAAGGRVVTAPTNGAAGILPAVLEYGRRFLDFDDEKILRYLLTAGAIALLFKENASISGAEVGCQGEVGVACSMAAAGLAAVRGGSTSQVENAAEIGMEHNLGLTCDPVRGLVQIPCIERNAMGATKAIKAARLALRGDGSHKVSLDKVIRTMRQTGEDMKLKYKETSRGGLAINVIEC